MKTAFDTYLKIQGLKERKRKPVMFWRVWFGGVCVDEGNNVAILKARYAGQIVTIKPVY